MFRVSNFRDSKNSKGKIRSLRREVIGTIESGEKFTLAEFAQSEWSIVNSPWSLQLPNKNNDDGHLLELNGPHTVGHIIFSATPLPLPV